MSEESLRDLWNTIKWTNVRIMEIPEIEEREKRPKIFVQEIMVENSPNMKGNEHLSQRNRGKKPKEIHTKKHYNQIVESLTLRENIESYKKKASFSRLFSKTV